MRGQLPFHLSSIDIRSFSRYERFLRKGGRVENAYDGRAFLRFDSTDFGFNDQRNLYFNLNRDRFIASRGGSRATGLYISSLFSINGHIPGFCCNVGAISARLCRIFGGRMEDQASNKGWIQDDAMVRPVPFYLHDEGGGVRRFTNVSNDETSFRAFNARFLRYQGRTQGEIYMVFRRNGRVFFGGAIRFRRVFLHPNALVAHDGLFVRLKRQRRLTGVLGL